MSKLSDRLKELRASCHMSQREIADIVKTSKSSINMYERGEREPGVEMLEAFADFYNVDMDYLVGKSDVRNKYAMSNNFPSNILPLPATVRRPLVGTIACGEPITASENVDEFVDVAADIRCDFVLRCKGDSMIDARIYDGDLVYIREQPDVENGQIAAVLIDGMETEATLKRVYKCDGAVSLNPANPAYAPLVFSGADADRVRILGLAVAFTSAIK